MYMFAYEIIETFCLMFWKDWYMIDLKLTYTRELTARNGNWVLTLHNWKLLMHKCWTTGLYTCIVVWSTDVYILVWSTDVHTCTDDWFTYLYDRLTYKQTNKQTIKLHLHIFTLITRILSRQSLWIVYFTIYNLFTYK